jgi:hypothetical protein
MLEQYIIDLCQDVTVPGPLPDLFEAFLIDVYDDDLLIDIFWQRYFKASIIGLVLHAGQNRDVDDFTDVEQK